VGGAYVAQWSCNSTAIGEALQVEGVNRRMIDSHNKALKPYVLNTRSEEENTVFYSYVVCCVNTSTLNMYGFLSYTGLTRRNT